jgi:hypothetical protein
MLGAGQALQACTMLMMSHQLIKRAAALVVNYAKLVANFVD